MAENEFTERKISTIKLIEHLLVKHDTYNHQKSHLAHAGIVLELVILTTIISLKKWPLQIISEKHLPYIWSTFIVFSIFWLLIHLFIRFNLQRQRWAAINYAAIFRVYRGLTKRTLNECDLDVSTKDNIKNIRSRKKEKLFCRLFNSY
jgi:hypothetical protein